MMKCHRRRRDESTQKETGELDNKADGRQKEKGFKDQHVYRQYKPNQTKKRGGLCTLKVQERSRKDEFCESVPVHRWLYTLEQTKHFLRSKGDNRKRTSPPLKRMDTK